MRVIYFEVATRDGQGETKALSISPAAAPQSSDEGVAQE